MKSVVKVFNNVKLKWTNFSGKPGEYNNVRGKNSRGEDIGDRLFNIVLTEQMAEELRNMELVTKSGKVVRGANVKAYVPDDVDADPSYTLKVSFGSFAPEAIWRVVPRGRMALNLDTVDNLDKEIIDHADVKVVFSAWEKGSKCGIGAYLQKLIAYVSEDDFDHNDDFLNIPIIGGDGSEANYGPDEDDEIPF